MRGPRTLLTALSMLALIAGCSSSGSSDGPRRDRNLITRAEVEAHSAIEAHELVRALRPNWMRSRASSVRAVVKYWLK